MEGKWRKSSYSNGGEANCVELVRTKQGLLTRDSKAPLSGMLSVTTGAVSFLAAVKVGRFDR